MKIYEIYEGKKQYWRSRGFRNNYWSSFEKSSNEQEDYFFIIALMLWFSMRLNGIKARLEIFHNTSKEKRK